MRTSEQIGELAAALAAAQYGFTNPERNRTVKVSMRSGGAYSFSYATLDVILAMAREQMGAVGLAVVQSVATQGVEGHGVEVTVTTRLMHSSGQWIESDLSALSGGEIQSIGSAITYLRRYSIVSLLGIASEEDDDANVAAGNVVQDVKAKKPQPLTSEEQVYVSDAMAQIAACESEELLKAMAEEFRTKSEAVKTALRPLATARLQVLKTKPVEEAY